MILVSSRLLFAAFLAIIVAACQTGGDTQTRPDGGNGGAAGSAQQNQVTNSRYFIEYRSRYALSYGHSYVIFGRLDQSGRMINPEVAGLHPASDSAAPYVLGHVMPVPAETGESDGDLEDEYRSASWRVMLSEAEYRKVVAFIRNLQASSPMWHAALYNCNAFVADIARSMGYKTPFIWLRPQQFIIQLREMNGGTGYTGPLETAQ
ncbi:hypothetical protein [Aquamicrobium sp. LC103]|uniref:hypothetical protein n=1 Tax=Aquamicrobium sp. LC103 TaxID=1120658 RepID=UPI00063E9B0E|nr:hypothetical protein [Aquamicrobium sp. LC103]TKT81463.1 hypothetical protein XW59_004205 [Aquamicrobium sp. LC103]